MVSLIGIHTRTGGVKMIPSRVGLYLNGVGLGVGEQHLDTIRIVRDTRVFPDGEAPPDFDTFVPSVAVSWEIYGRYWYSERTKQSELPDGNLGWRNHKEAWAVNPADYYQICNEQAGGEGADVPAKLQQLINIERAIMQAANADGRKCCILNLAGGSPGDFELWKSICAPFIVEAWESGGNIYGRHLYADWFVNDAGAVNPGQPARVLAELEYLRSLGYGGGVVLTEAGLFGGYGVADYPFFEQQVKRLEQLLLPYSDMLIGFCWWQMGTYKDFNSDYTQHMKALVPYLEQATLPRWTPPEVEQPMEKHKAIVVKVAQDVTAEEWEEAAVTAYPFRHTMTASHDDMMTILAGGNAESYVKFSHPDRDGNAVDLVEAAGYGWQPLYGETPKPPTAVKLVYRPCQTAVITQLFGANPGNYDDFGLPGHDGLDYAVGKDLPFYAAADGTVVHASDRKWSSSAASGYGWHVVLSHGEYCTVYAHARPDLPVVLGQTVKAGQVVGYSGNTGNSTGYHLHFGLLDKTGTIDPGNGYPTWLHGRPVNPAPHLAGKPAPPLPPPPAQTVDMTQYYLPPNGRTYGDISIKPTNWGQGDVRQQLQLHGGYLFVTKGGEFEKRMILDGRIYFLIDDSPGDGKYYIVNSPTGWIPAQWAVGQTFTRQETTTFYFKSNCQPTGEVANWTNVMLFKALFPEWTSPHGIKLANVAHLQWLVNGVVEEDYYLAPGLGYAGWKNKAGRESWIKELIPYTDQQPNKIAGSCYHEAFG